MKEQSHRFCFAFLLVLLVLPCNEVMAQGDLMIMPKRVVFDGIERSQEISLANTGQDTAVYAISFINYRMTEDGKFEKIETPDPEQRFATDFLRYFPRRVKLAPNEAQTIRVQLTRTGNLQDGEYRSHMYFRAVEEQTALGSENEKKAEGISINIKTVFGISIPIIIRNGNKNKEITLSRIQLLKSEESPELSLVINRSGNISVYGDLEVVHTSPEGKKTVVGLVKGISVYTPNKKRRFSFQLQPQGADLSDGELKITYSDKSGTLATVKEKLE